jgi:Eukaryotic-type carbonic anhydrase
MRKPLLVLLVQTGWVDKWEYGVEWQLGGSCEWCPDDTTSGGSPDSSCEKHHQSPINVERYVADESSGQFKECIDLHWMKYHDSACSYDQLVAKNAIFVDRHALRIVQPIVPGDGGGNLTHRLACRSLENSWGRIDFSKGFSQWWYLSHIDFHVPSEHLQEGKRYDGELQMYHFYSVSGQEAGVNNQVRVLCSLFLISPCLFP